MISDLIDLMENPELYEASWRDGVLYVRRVDADLTASRPSPKPHLVSVRRAHCSSEVLTKTLGLVRAKSSGNPAFRVLFHQGHSIDTQGSAKG